MNSLIPLFQLLHSWTRWIVLAVVIVAIVYFILGVVQRRPWTRQAQTLLSAFTGVISLQWLLGLILFLLYQVPAGFGIRYQWEHLVIMTIAVGAASMSAGWRRREMPDANRWRNGLLLMIAVIVIVIVGIGRLPDAVQWRFYVPA